MKLWYAVISLATYLLCALVLVLVEPSIYGKNASGGTLLFYFILFGGAPLVHDIMFEQHSKRAEVVAGLLVNDDGTIGRRP